MSRDRKLASTILSGIVEATRCRDSALDVIANVGLQTTKSGLGWAEFWNAENIGATIPYSFSFKSFSHVHPLFDGYAGRFVKLTWVILDRATYIVHCKLYFPFFN